MSRAATAVESVARTLATSRVIRSRIFMLLDVVTRAAPVNLGAQARD
jgi:hypothetical protein